MLKPTKTSGKVLQLVARPPSPEGQLEQWFFGVMRSNHDLSSALERLRDSYKMLLADKVPGETDQAVLRAVETTLKNARNARAL